MRSPWLDFLLARDSRVALATLLSGGAGMALLALGVGLIGHSEPMNYTHNSMFASMAYLAIAAAGGYMAGAYAGAGAVWVVSERERDYSPALVAFGSLLGPIAVFVLTVALSMLMVPWGQVPGVALVVQTVSGIMQLATPIGAFLGARLACRLTFPRWQARPLRAVQLAAVVAVVLGCSLYASLPQPDFPASGSPAERQAWAEKTFGTPYEKAEAFLRAEPALAGRVGAIAAIAPVEGPNHTAATPGELMGTFTLEVQGEKARGVARLTFMHGSAETTVESYGFSGSFEGEGQPLSLGMRR